MAVTGYNAPTANKPLNVRDRDILEVAIAIYIPKRIYIAKPTLPPSLIYRTRYTPDMSLYTAFEKWQKLKAIRYVQKANALWPFSKQWQQKIEEKFWQYKENTQDRWKKTLKVHHFLEKGCASWQGFGNRKAKRYHDRVFKDRVGWWAQYLCKLCVVCYYSADS